MVQYLPPQGMRKIRIILTCYRYIAIPGPVITLVLSYQLWLSQSWYFLPFAILAKIITTCLLLLFIFIFRSKQFYFFNNLGLSNPSIYGAMAFIDFFVAATAFGITLQLL